MEKFTAKYIEKFWTKIDKERSVIFYNGTRCWEWTTGCDTSGYGCCWMGIRQIGAHRVAYELTFGEIPKGLFVLHHCDNRLCVNPDHFFLGTHQDNSDDKVQKNRQAKGERLPQHKLTDAQVEKIRHRYKWYGIGGETATTLAKKFGVSHQQIYDIIKLNSR